MRLMDEESFWIFRDHIFTWWCFIRVPRETIYLHSCHQSHCYIILQIPWILLASKWLVLYSVATLPVAFSRNFSLNLTLTLGPYWSSSSYIYYGKSYLFITQVHSGKFSEGLEWKCKKISALLHRQDSSSYSIREVIWTLPSDNETSFKTPWERVQHFWQSKNQWWTGRTGCFLKD